MCCTHFTSRHTNAKIFILTHFLLARLDKVQMPMTLWHKLLDKNVKNVFSVEICERVMSTEL